MIGRRRAAAVDPPERHRSAGPLPLPPVGGPVVELRAVRRRFGDVVALDGFDLSAPAGSVTVLVGPNGAGKTTALRIVTGALAPDAGEVRTFGLDPAVDGEEIRRRCGVVSAKPALYDRLSGRDNLRYSARLHGLDRHADVGWAAARFGIEHALDQLVGGYSTGMKTRLALARAVLHRPDLLLLDEPTSGLDPESAHAVLALIRSMAAEGSTVVLCTHLLLEADGLADNVVVLEDGAAAVAGSPGDLARAWLPDTVLRVDAEDRAVLDTLATAPGVLAYERDGGPATLSLDGPERVPDVVAALVAAGARVTRLEPRTPSLEDVYLAIRRRPRPGGDGTGAGAGS